MSDRLLEGLKRINLKIDKIQLSIHSEKNNEANVKSNSFSSSEKHLEKNK